TGDSTTFSEVFTEARCSLCGAKRINSGGKPGACSLIGCKDPLFDLRAEKQKERNAALESLLTSIKDNVGWRIGYNPAFTAAVKRMHELEAK
ncbi:MAG TPA: hypothetical protein VKU42_11665, partial [Candidatus Angelobacter sp.]|nr:hypothetical protein [Candidatus Angelobacter sp.]